MRSLISVCSAAMVAAALATPAAAQVVGTYSGTSADGQSLTFVVGTDTTSGEPAVTAATGYFSAPCRGSSYVLETGWGFGTLNDIKKGKTKISVSGNYFTIAVSLDFASDGQSATGTITSISPTLEPVGTRPTKALICTSPKQDLTVALQPADVPTGTSKAHNEAIEAKE